MRSKRTLLFIAALIFLSCAVMEAPSGGPKDETPPELAGILPLPGSTGVDRDSSVEISFSEKVDGDSFKKLVQIYPPLEFDKMRAKNEVFEILFQDELPETTICVVIRKGYTDKHNVKGKREINFCFSTADSIDKGTISGRVFFKMSPDSTGLAKLVAVSDIDSTGNLTRTPESRMAFCGSDGYFAFEALPTNGTMFRLWVFTDRNGDTRFSPGDEFHTVLEDTFSLTSGISSIDGLEINIIDPDEPGKIEGTISDLTGLGISPTARFEPLYEDGKPLVVSADTTGRYAVLTIPPGGYIFTAFIDAFADSLPGTYTDPDDSTKALAEPVAVYPDTVIVPPGETITLEPLQIQKDTGRER
jgi:hypothetical protein